MVVVDPGIENGNRDARPLVAGRVNATRPDVLDTPRVVQLDIESRDLDVRIDSHHARISTERFNRGAGQAGRNRGHDAIGMFDGAAEAPNLVHVSSAGMTRKQDQHINPARLLQRGC